ncbi:toll-like receptor 9 [Lepisosteus oculatus]|uniref:toll-like receptor 9 n=1 Tax=Lepisosteus oculatus TaxID=7918 RepID=UPI00371C9164
MASPRGAAALPGFLAVLVSLLPPGAATYPPFLPCGSPSPQTVDCAAHGLTRVPLFRAPTGAVTALLLSGNHISRIPADAFALFRRLETLELQWNGLLRPGVPKAGGPMVLAPRAFEPLAQLRSLDLRGNGLRAVPLLPPSLRTLDLSYNRLLLLEPPARPPALAALQTLRLDGNCYYNNPCGHSQGAPRGFLAGMGRLRELSLGHNNLTAVPGGLPAGLRRLALHYNQISAVAPGDFGQLARLSSLDLKGNCRRCEHAPSPCIKCARSALHLPAGCFASLGSLKSLNLSDNSLASLNDSVFAPLRGLEELLLSDNLLSRTSPNGNDLVLGSPAFRGFPRLRSLDLSYNYRRFTVFRRLALTEDFAGLARLQSLQITGCFFQSVDNASVAPLAGLPELRLLNLRLNFIKNIELHIFDSLAGLSYLRLSDNEISCTRCRGAPGKRPGLPDHRLTPGSSLQARGLSAPEPQVGLPLPESCTGRETLNLMRNNLVYVQKELFEGFERIECLILSHNSISQSFNGNQFILLKRLKLLDLSYNRIDLYYKAAFSELPSLEVLDLSNNNYHFQLSGMGHRLDFIAGLPSLRLLDLGFDSISDRISTALASSSLNKLVFRHNRLQDMWNKKIYFQFFRNLTNLTSLDLSNNLLTRIPPEGIYHLPPTLRDLNLKFNKLTSFPWEALSAFPCLEILDLSYNWLSTLSRSLHPGSYIPPDSGLRSLNLSSNRIHAIDRDFFRNATALASLLLSDNQLEQVDLDNCLLQRLRVLDIRWNRLVCTCDSSFYELFSNFNFSVPALTSQVTCGSPDRLRGRSVFSRDALLCPSSRNVAAFLLSLALALPLTALPVLRQVLGWDAWYAFYVWVARAWGLFYKGGEGSAYDAFVAFDKEQESVADWVYNELRVQLEDSGAQRFRLCLEERDWLPGRSSIENLHEAVQGSRKTVFVLPRAGPAGGLLREAFFLAQQRLLEERADVAVFVLLEKGRRGSRYLQLRRLLCRETVLLWPQNPQAQGYFWHRLRCVLARDIQASYDRKFSLSFEA